MLTDTRSFYFSSFNNNTLFKFWFRVNDFLCILSSGESCQPFNICYDRNVPFVDAY